METSGSAGMYVKLSQVVFVALGILSIYLSISLQSGPWPIVATFAVPILFALAFAGVIAERSQLQVTHDNNVS
jgi:lipopolysaccharide export LptBFGC system permease protein LptF